MNLTLDARFDLVTKQTKYLTYDRQAGEERLACKEHGLVKPMMIGTYMEHNPEKCCPYCFHHVFRDSVFEARPVAPVKMVRCSHASGCPSYVDPDQKCCFCHEPFCDAHGDKKYHTCHSCAEEVEAHIVTQPF